LLLFSSYGVTLHGNIDRRLQNMPMKRFQNEAIVLGPFDPFYGSSIGVGSEINDWDVDLLLNLGCRINAVLLSLQSDVHQD